MISSSVIMYFAGRKISHFHGNFLISEDDFPAGSLLILDLVDELFRQNIVCAMEVVEVFVVREIGNYKVQ